MTPASNFNSAPSDEASREAIRTKLDTTMLVEAGAGSGKTTLMVDRLLAYIARGTPVDQLAAVTFTKKAANELRQRLEARIEQQAREQTGETRDRFVTALRDRERMFIGTVHAFCGRVLREHALDAGLPPDFTELDESESTLLRQSAWRAFIESLALQNDELLNAVAAVGIDPLTLFSAFAKREQYRDVEFPAPKLPAPSHTKVRDALHEMMKVVAQVRAKLDGKERDKLQRTIDRLWRSFHVHDEWASPADFAQDAATLLSASNRAVVQKHWGDTKEAKLAGKQLGILFDEFVDQQLAPWFERWWAHAYAPVVALFNAGSDWALQLRRRSGKLGFDDLLTETAHLLRTNASARQSIGERWRYLLVDEFQDTDPVQAEVCFLIASDPGEGNDWRTVNLRPGSLFVVGDPKQSIYRFRRADLAMYRLVQQRIAACGSVEKLTRNFRSVPAIGALVNEHFAGVFTAPGDNSAQTEWQAPFAEFVAACPRPPHAANGVQRYQVGGATRASNPQIIAQDAAMLASWIAKRCSVEGDRQPQDFLILTPRRPDLTAYAHELAVRNVPVAVTGAPSAADEVLRELLVVMRALANPGNPIAVIAALEGWCVGCSHADLWDARVAELEFRITHAPADRSSVVGAGLQQLHEWWVASQQLPSATLLERVMNESGLLIVAASSDMGDKSAGRLLQLISRLHGGGSSDLQAAIEAVEQSLNAEEDSSTLRPARADAVRLMNLHKAKGLEARVVILAAPVPPPEHPPAIVTWRDSAGVAHGALTVADDTGHVLAQPDNWEELANAESVRIGAEWNRLLYVAVTRAEEELVVSQRAPFALASGEVRGDTSRWSPLAEVLNRHARELHLTVDVPPGRKVVTVPAAQIRSEIAEATIRLAQARPPRYVLISVTEAVKRNAEQAEQDGAPLVSEAVDLELSEAPASTSTETISRSGKKTLVDPRTFGSLVHAAIEGALRGRAGAELATFARALVWHELTAASDTEREELTHAVLRAVDEARQSESWSLLMSGDGPALAELNVASFSVRANTAVLTEGVIDAATLRGGQWVVVDWKLNRSSDAVWQQLRAGYERQAASYVETLEARTGAASVPPRIERLGISS